MTHLLERLFRIVYGALNGMRRVIRALDQFWTVVLSASWFLACSALDVAALAAIQAGTLLLAAWCFFPARHAFMTHEIWERVIPWLDSYGTFPAVLIVAAGETLFALWLGASFRGLLTFRLTRLFGDDDEAPRDRGDPDEVEMPDPLWF